MQTKAHPDALQRIFAHRLCKGDTIVERFGNRSFDMRVEEVSTARDGWIKVRNESATNFYRPTDFVWVLR